MLTDYWESRRTSIEKRIDEYDAGQHQKDRAQINKWKRTIRMLDAQKKGTHTVEQWADLKREFGSHCVRCWSDKFNLEKDHIIPVYQGGSDSIENIQPVCALCNVSKGPETFNWKEHRRKNGLD